MFNPDKTTTCNPTNSENSLVTPSMIGVQADLLMGKNANAKNQHTCPISSIFDTVNFTKKKTSFSKIGSLRIRHQQKCHSILVISNIVIT